ncbi:hypothetical protein SNEBB_011020 [Seison nebaliae]|nr:hypothetical protein SNEBB_011020 [Seison nebaliae]
MDRLKQQVSGVLDNPRIPLINLNSGQLNITQRRYKELREDSEDMNPFSHKRPPPPQPPSSGKPPPIPPKSIGTSLIGAASAQSNYGGASSTTTKHNLTPSTTTYKTMHTQVGKSRKKVLMQHVGYRLGKRKELHRIRRRYADIMFCLAIGGILLMMLETELAFKQEYSKVSASSVIIKGIITTTTIILMGLVLFYHKTDIAIYCIDNSIDSWKIALTTNRIVLVLIELVICAIHPIPGQYMFEWTTHHYDYLNSQARESVQQLKSVVSNLNKQSNVTIPPELIGSGARIQTRTVPVDILLSIPMFARMYLLARIIMLHSKLYTDASSQSLGYLNRINFNFRFVFKALMSQCPDYVLGGIIAFVLFIASWSVRACEYYHDEDHMSYWNSMWIIAITFLTVGYGDLVPNTYCGRTISVLAGTVGVFCTALIVAVLSRKLEMTRAERYVSQFVTETELAKHLRHSAANVVKYGWLIYRLRLAGHSSTSACRKRQQQLLAAIQQIREIKQEQRVLTDNAVTVLELFKQQHYSSQIIEQVAKLSRNFTTNIHTIEDRIDTLEQKMTSIQDMLLTLTMNR